MLKQTITKWNQSLETYKNGNVKESLRLLESVDPTSKILYNMGMMSFKESQYSKAIDYFTKSVELDRYLACAYYMMAVSYHMSGDSNHAIVYYDETLAKLRGHEYIDYKQLGMDYRLLEVEVLFNKALALGRAGQPVANMALQIKTLPTNDKNFPNDLRKVAEGQTSTFKPRTAPLEILFQPPKVSDKGPPKVDKFEAKLASSPPSYYSSSSSSYASSAPSSNTNNISTSPPSSSSSGGALPPPPQRKLPNVTPTLPTPPSPSSNSIPNAPPLPITKKLPSRPISMVINEITITIKCYYQDRRLIQVTNNCTMSTLQQKIQAKFGIDYNLLLKYKSPEDEFIFITAQKELANALSLPIQELYLIETMDEINQFEHEAKPTIPSSSTSQQQQQQQKPNLPPQIPMKPKVSPSSPSSLTSSFSPSTSPTSSDISTPSPPPRPQFGTLKRNQTTTPTPSTPSTPSPSLSTISTNQKFNTLRNVPTTTPVIPPRHNTLTRGDKSSLTSSSSSSSSAGNGVAIPPRPAGTLKRPAMVNSSSPKPINNFTSASSSYQLSSSVPYHQSNDISFDDSQIELPYKVCFSPSGEKFYLNLDTGQVYWNVSELEY